MITDFLPESGAGVLFHKATLATLGPYSLNYCGYNCRLFELACSLGVAL